MSNTLVELVDEYREVIKAIMSDAEAGEEEVCTSLQTKLESVNLQMAQKVDAYVYVLDQLKQENLYWKDRAKKASHIAKTVDNSVRYIKYHLKQNIENLNASEVLGEEHKLKIVKNAPSLIIEHEDLIPEQYLTQVVTTEIDKAAIKADLKVGKSVPGCHLLVGKSVRSYTNRSSK